VGIYWIKHKIIYSYITSHFSHFLSTAGLESASRGLLPGVMLKSVTECVFFCDVTYLLSPTTKMVNVVPTDSEEDAHLRRPKRNPKTSAALLNNPKQATLLSQQQAIENFRIAEAARRAAETKLAIETEAINVIPSPNSSHSSSPVAPSGSEGPVPSSARSSRKSKNKRAYVSDEEESDDEREDARTNPKPPGTFLSFGSGYIAEIKASAKKSRASAISPEQEVAIVDEDGILADIDVQSVAESGSTRESKTIDINWFFSAPYDHQGANGKVTKHRKCKICP